MVSHEEQRKIRIGIIKRSMKEAGKHLDKEKLIAVCCMDWGCSRRTVLEYLKMIELANG